jgi:hypothetical protein
MTPDRLSEIEARLARDPAYDMPRLYERIDRVELWTLAKAVERNDIALLLRLVRTAQRHLGNISRSVGNPEEYALGVLNEMDAILAEAERIKKGEG